MHQAHTEPRPQVERPRAVDPSDEGSSSTPIGEHSLEGAAPRSGSRRRALFALWVPALGLVLAAWAVAVLGLGVLATAWWG